jgi:hypothetical protein
MRRLSGWAILLSGALLLLAAWAQTTGYNVTASGFTAFLFDAGPENPTLQLQRGRTYNFTISSGGAHPFYIKTAQVTGSGSAYDTGVGGAGNGATSGTLTFTVPGDAPDTLYYICGNHGSMTGTLSIVDAPRQADFDGDGRSDIFWRNLASGENYLYPMNGTAILGTEGYARTVADQNWRVAAIADFDGDGRADLLWRNFATGENYVYLMNGTAIAGEGYIRTVADQNWQVAGAGDFDGDGKADILWRSAATGENYLYPMDGLAIKATEGYVRTVANLDWNVVGTGDMDGDGKADVLWRNGATGENYLYPMDGTTIKPAEGFLRTVPDQNWRVAGFGDFDGDGNADVLWRNVATGENYLYPMDGTTILGTEGYLRTVPDLYWQVKGTGDYDGDGSADILWRNGATGENYLYPMNGTTIKPTEGYLRTVADESWRIPVRDYAGEPLELAGITALHNQVRAAVETGTPLAALQWESALAATARSWAATCDFSHNPSRSVGHPYVVGENIYGSSAAATAQAAVSLWAAEEQYYDYSTNSCTAGQTCGHYTQLVWRTTLRLGCALQDCEGSTPRYRIVCNYGPGGNSIGLPY